MKGRNSLFGALLVAAVAIAMLAPAANAATPAPGYSQFAGCPTKAENPEMTSCIHSVVKSGHFNMGNKEVPITEPIHLSGGTAPLFQNFAFNSEGGLKPAKQKVPGGVVGLTGLTWLLELLGSEALTLYAVTELAGTPKLGVTTLQLPIKVHLINNVLGKNCYVGSNSSPIVLNMTTGTTSPPPPNTPISGSEPEISFDPASKINFAKNAKFVDNSFAAPGANGCTLTLFGFIPISINGIVNSASGLPAAAGTNETVQVIDLEFVNINRVYP